MTAPIRVFKYSMGWSWTCSACGIGVTSAQWQVWDTQPAAMVTALRHCMNARLNPSSDLYAALRARARRRGGSDAA